MGPEAYTIWVSALRKKESYLSFENFTKIYDHAKVSRAPPRQEFDPES